MELIRQDYSVRDLKKFYRAIKSSNWANYDDFVKYAKALAEAYTTNQASSDASPATLVTLLTAAGVITDGDSLETAGWNYGCIFGVTPFEFNTPTIGIHISEDHSHRVPCATVNRTFHDQSVTKVYDLDKVFKIIKIPGCAGLYEHVCFAKLLADENNKEHYMFSGGPKQLIKNLTSDGIINDVLDVETLGMIYKMLFGYNPFTEFNSIYRLYVSLGVSYVDTGNC